MLVSVIFVAIVVVVLLVIFVPQAFKKVVETGQSQLEKGGHYFWTRDPIGILQHRIDKAAGEVHEATKTLEYQRAMVSSLDHQIRDGEAQIAGLDAKIRNALQEQAKPGSNPEWGAKAAKYAVELSRERTQLVTNQSQMNQAQVAYENNLKKLKALRDEIEDARETARRKNTELRTSKIDAATASLAQKFNLQSGSIDGLGEVISEVDDQINQNRAKSQVAYDLGSDGMKAIEEREAVRQSQAQDILAEYKNKMGLGTTAPPKTQA